ncbi:hypothetical protein SCLARK_001169 [Spiroplasma clarkii]|uniref:Uncharacterized protein n=1 Tax=Spiroplasma clarkii TaxID=2139 RepID=A0A1Y0L149_9MOLU|nr:hypothetical protein [Spiroplasma clarkii]ARU91727.1 hypothetical protein SCLARK_001169 [Spiroplasma clarkii]ATX71110.1 hypothetical protein SCLAR_v1c07970 [Spiroplasma clarkii]
MKPQKAQEFKKQKVNLQVNWYSLLIKIIYTFGLCSTAVVFTFSIINGWWPITIICGIFSIIFSVLFKKIFYNQSDKKAGYECVYDAAVDGKLNE